jgi:hypothetical protein
MFSRITGEYSSKILLLQLSPVKNQKEGSLMELTFMNRTKLDLDMRRIAFVNIEIGKVQLTNVEVEITNDQIISILEQLLEQLKNKA